MRLLVKPDDEQRKKPGAASDTPGDNLSALREQGNRLAAAGDNAINRALNGGNSEAFLRAGRQQGGE